MPTKTAIIDDAGYLITNAFMRGHSGGRKGGQVFDLYNDIGDNFLGLIWIYQASFRRTLLFISLCTRSKARMVVRSSSKRSEKFLMKRCALKVWLRFACVVCRWTANTFSKHTDGSDITKSPEGYVFFGWNRKRSWKLLIQLSGNIMD